jgi:hypothetical protein
MTWKSIWELPGSDNGDVVWSPIRRDLGLDAVVIANDKHAKLMVADAYMRGLCMLPGEIRELVVALNARLRQARREIKAKRHIGQ